MKRIGRYSLAVAAMALFLNGYAAAQETTSPEKDQDKAESAASDTKQGDAKEADRGQRLADYLSGARFVGKFTIEGKEDALPKTEEYTISKCEKLAQPDMYRLTARIKYGDVDSEVPLDLKILWAGNTPVITMDAFWIPGMGNFGARVMIHSGRYAGTWQHDAVGGHLFGVIKKDE
ncbi:MAG: hypothetical protein ACR2NZ_17780 [Rubripirellula sp.]